MIIVDGVEYKLIPGLTDYYVSKRGFVYSTRRNKILKSHQDKKGYLNIYPMVGHNQKRAMHVHRAVALAWIPNPDNKPEVHHKDEDKTNNSVDNLAWVTTKENVNAGTRTARMAKTNSKPVILTSIKDGSEMYFPSTWAARRAGYNPDSCLAGISHQVKGYTVRYADKK